MILKDGRVVEIKKTMVAGRWLTYIDGIAQMYTPTLEEAWNRLNYIELADGTEEIEMCCVYSGLFNGWYRGKEAHYVEDVDDWVPDNRVIWDYNNCPQLDERCVQVHLSGHGYEYITTDELDENWHFCDRCNEYVQTDSYDYDEEMCDDCVEDFYRDCVIGRYHSHRKDVWFAEDGESVREGIGFELEIDGNPESCGNQRGQFNSEFAKRLLADSGLDDDECVFETDSSLESGFEIISMPHTVRSFWNRRYKFATMLTLCSEAGYKSHSTATCGLHVHVSRSLFGSNPKRIKRALAKIHRFYEDRWHDLVRASRRKDFFFCDRNSSDGLAKKSPLKDWEKVVGNGYHCNAINESHFDTVEFRLGRGTLKPGSFFAWIDLTLAIVKNSRKSEKSLCDDAQWLEGIEFDTAKYLLGRGAFVNEVKRLYPGITETREEELMCA